MKNNVISLEKQHEYNKTNHKKSLTNTFDITDLTGVNTGPRTLFNWVLTVEPRTSVGAQLIRMSASKTI